MQAGSMITFRSVNTVDAFRGAIAGNTSIANDLIVLAGIAIVCAVLTLLIYIGKDRKFKKKNGTSDEPMQGNVQVSLAGN